ncbi:type IV secretion protein Rhs [Corynebacterium tuscaniense]|uniref:Type IV secretion protein Rhs n=1 Tax=Corynebacterium tuscaniense TaxID=302449 RepID=A0A2N6T6E7_9CORY|nr:RHS repeat-associated core domain-containing protein [Corynebacterium tuscaniense]PMC64906.1 type IV secretion protein Rhs [Corynebacterium tuscaniense]
MGIEIGLSALVHRSGASIEYSWDTATGHMTEMRRSDNTILHISWDDTVDRVASISVTNPETHPEDEPLQLISYEYDPYGQLVRVINSNDGALQYHYDDFGRMHAWTDRNGASYFYRYDEHGRVHSQVGTGGMFPNIVYWAQDTGVDAPEGGTVCVAIETAGEFQGDPLELGDSVVSDYLDRLEQLPLYQALASGGLEAAGLTGRGRTAHRDDDKWNVPSEWLHDDFLGDIRPTVYRSTPAGDVWRIVTPEGGVEDTTYNSYHQTTSITNSAGATFTYAYNEDGILTCTGYPDGLESRIDPGSWGSPVRLIGRDGQATEYEVDAFGMIESVTDPAGLTTSFTYDVRPSGIVPSSVTDPDGTITRIECDNAGLTLATTDSAGRRSSMVRDVRGLIIEAMDPVGATTSITYTPEGWPQRVTNPDGTTLFSTFDGEGNQLTAVNEIGARTTTTYTVFDIPVSTTDATGATTRVEYNTQMQPIRLTNADNNTWSYTYDLDGMIAAEVDYNGITTNHSISPDGLTITDSAPAGVTEVRLRADGLTDSVTDVLGTTTYLYDDVARLTALVGPHARIDYRRDDFGRVTGETVTLTTGEITAHDYTVDHAGNITAEHVTLPLGDTFTSAFARDENGDLTSSHHSRTSRGSTASVTVADLTYGIDARGIRNRITTGSLVREIHTDIRGRTTKDAIVAIDSAVTGGQRRVSSRMFEWRADDALAAVTDQIRGHITYGLDVLGRATSVTCEPNPRTNDVHPNSFSVDRDAAGSSERYATIGEHYGFSQAGVLSMIDTGRSTLSKKPASPRSLITRSGEGSVTPDALVEFDGTKPVRVGRTSYSYDASGRVTKTVTKRISKKPLVHEFFYAAGEQPIGFASSDEPGIGYRYLYDPAGRRVAKERISTNTGDVLTRTIYAHADEQLVAEQTTIARSAPSGLSKVSHPDVGDGYVWTIDPATGEVTGQIRLISYSARGEYTDKHGDPDRKPELGGADAMTCPQDDIDAEFMLIMSDLAGSPQELIDPVSGWVAGRATQSLYGVRTWHGPATSPLLYAGQYMDAESGWAYNRFRYYNPQAGIYNAQDPLGAAPRIASPQGYVDHAAYWIDEFGLAAHVKDVNLQKLINKMTPNGKGQLGERAMKLLFDGLYDPLNPRLTYYNASGKMRISDLKLNQTGVFWFNGEALAYNAGDIVESKFVKKQGLSKQIKDGLDHAGSNIYHLVVAPETKLSRPLRKMAENNPNFNIIRMTDPLVWAAI